MAFASSLSSSASACVVVVLGGVVVGGGGLVVVVVFGISLALCSLRRPTTLIATFDTLLKMLKKLKFSQRYEKSEDGTKSPWYERYEKVQGRYEKSMVRIVHGTTSPQMVRNVYGTKSLAFM